MFPTDSALRRFSTYKSLSKVVSLILNQSLHWWQLVLYYVVVFLHWLKYGQLLVVSG